MKKIIKTVTLASTLISLSAAYAGSMGPVSTEVISSWIPFISAEGAYTWNQFEDYTLNQYTIQPTSQFWGGRAAVGLIHPYSERLSFSIELGGGYYGGIKQSASLIGINTKLTIDGYDILGGAIYKINQFDVFGGVGFMSENNRQTLTQDLSTTIPGGVYSGTIKSKTNQTQTFPEIKVGGIYNLNENWGISLAYMHVFGTSPGGNASVSETASSIVKNIDTTTQNSTLNSIMLGLRYSIV